jgi:hypothetical protein
VPNKEGFMLIQNAVLLLHNLEVVVSTHVHDCQMRTLPDGRVVGVDGGLEYVRFIGDLRFHAESLRLCDDSPFSEIVEKLVWGTRGRSGDQPLKYVFLKDRSTQHLRSILLKTDAGPYHRAVIAFILACRKTGRMPIPDSFPE